MSLYLLVMVALWIGLVATDDLAFWVALMFWLPLGWTVTI